MRTNVDIAKELVETRKEKRVLEKQIAEEYAYIAGKLNQVIEREQALHDELHIAEAELLQSLTK